MTGPYPQMRDDQLQRYLALLELPAHRPSLDGLQRLVRAQLCRVPFENISKLYNMRQPGFRHLPDLESYLDGIERFHFGGTCYSNNFHFYQLLANLGYRMTLCGADMSDPDVHLVSMARIDGGQYLVDVGYAAPFVAPLPRDLATDHVIHSGRDRYVLKPQDEEGCSRMDLYRGGKLTHSYRAKPTPRRIEEFEAVAADSYRDEATFMNAILLARYCPERSVVIHNLKLFEIRGNAMEERTLKTHEVLARAIEDEFGIPQRISADALGRLGSLGDAWR